MGGCCSSSGVNKDAEEIDISSQNLKQIPPYVFQTRRLLRLKMAKNSVSVMPADISNYANLMI